MRLRLTVGDLVALALLAVLARRLDARLGADLLELVVLHDLVVRMV